MVATYQKLAGYEDDYCVVEGGLSVESGYLVLHLLERQANKLLHDLLPTHTRCVLKRKDALVMVERLQLRTVRIERLVVVLNESLQSENTQRT